MSNLVQLSEDKLNQLEDQLENAYDNIFSGDRHKYNPKKRSITNVISDNLPLILVSAVGTHALLKVSKNFAPVPVLPWEF
jgi:hypothetical protein